MTRINETPNPSPDIARLQTEVWRLQTMVGELQRIILDSLRQIDQKLNRVMTHFGDEE